MSTLELKNVPTHFRGAAHQIEAVRWLGKILIKTPAQERLKLTTPTSWINRKESDLEWLQRQISKPTLDKFTSLWRAEETVSTYESHLTHFSQLNNPILPYTSCNSSSHAMFTDYILRNKLDKPGLGNDIEFVKRVYSGNYGTFGRNNSVSWDIQIRVCKSFGVNSEYSNSGKQSLINEVTNRNSVAPTNFRHKGTISNPNGGHVVVIADYEAGKGFLIYDPYGFRMPNYTRQKEGEGIYWMTEQEFDARWQGLFTLFKR